MGLNPNETLGGCNMSDQTQLDDMQKLINKINKCSKEQQELLQESLTNVHIKLDRLQKLIVGISLFFALMIGIDRNW